MKIKLILSVFLIAFLTSCSNDENSVSGDSGNYFPLTNGNYWTYDIVGQATGRDSLYVANDTIIGNATFKKMKTQFLASGFFSNSLRQNAVRTNGNLVQLSGGLGFDLGTGFPINLSVSNFTILKNNASANEQLSSTSGTFTQVLDTYPLTFNYTLKSVADGSLPSFTSPNGSIYTDVQKTKIILTLKITTTTNVPGTTFPITVTVLDTQDVVNSTQYYAKNIGMFYTNTNISYEINPDFASFLPIPSSGNETQQEFLDTYLAN
jgi:hypothetical protein